MMAVVGIRAGVQFDGIGAHFVRGADLTPVRVDEQTDRNLRVVEEANQGGEPPPMFRYRKPAFGGEFLSPFRDQRDFIGPDAQRNLRGRVVRSHFQIQSGRDDIPKQIQVPFLDVATIFTEMDDQAVRAAQVRQYRCGNGIRLMPASGLPERGDMVDIDAESGHGNLSDQVGSEDMLPGIMAKRARGSNEPCLIASERARS